MTKLKFIIPLFVVLLLSACNTYKYSSRVVNTQTANNTQITPSAVDVRIDFSKKIVATSNFAYSEEDAKQNAWYNAVKNNDIDILVSPVYEIYFESATPGGKCRAKVTGYAGYFSNARSVTEQRNIDADTKLKALGDMLKLEPIANQKSTTVIIPGTENANGAVKSPLNLVEQFELLYDSQLPSQPVVTEKPPVVQQEVPLQLTTTQPLVMNQPPVYKKQKSPFLAGATSFLVPGVGQFMNGDTGKGWLMMGINVVSFGLIMIAGSDAVDNPGAFGFPGLILFAGDHIWSMLDAAKTAKSINVSRSIGLNVPLNNGMEFNIRPDVNFTNFGYTKPELVYGAKLSLNF